MTTPTLLLRPEGSRNRAGTIVPTVNNPAPVVAGQYGQAWLIEEATLNSLPNSSVETNITSWSQVGTGTTLSQDASEFFVGSKSLKIVADGSGAAIQGAFQNSVASSASVGQTWTVSTSVKGTPGSYGRLLLREVGGSAPFSSAPFTVTSEWQRVTLTRTLTDPAATGVSIRIDNGSVLNTPYTMYVDTAQTEEKPYATSYADGSLDGCDWTGPEHASSSTRAAGTIAAAHPETVSSVLVRYRESGSTLVASQIGVGVFGEDGLVSLSGGILTVSTTKVIDLESVLVFDTVLTSEAVSRLSTRPWTWENVVSVLDNLENPPPVLIGGSGGGISIDQHFYRSNKAGQRIDDISEFIMKANVSLNQDDLTSPWLLRGDTSRADVFQRYFDYLIPTMELTYPDGSTSGEIQLGHYRIRQAPKRHPASGSLGSFVAEDITSVLARHQLMANTTVPAGTVVTDYITSTLLSLGFSSAQIAIPSIAKTPSVDSVYYTGDSWEAVINNLLQAVGYRSLYMLQSGALTTSESVELTSQTATVKYENATIVGIVDEDHDDSRLRNIVTVRRITPGMPVISATAKNEDPSSPLWIDGPIGQLASPPIDEPQLADADTALVRAKSELSYGASFYSKATVNTIPDPNIGLFQVIELDVRDREGNVQLDGTFMRRTIELALGPMVSDMGQGMKSSLNRVVPFPITVEVA